MADSVAMEDGASDLRDASFDDFVGKLLDLRILDEPESSGLAADSFARLDLELPKRTLDRIVAQVTGLP